MANIETAERINIQPPASIYGTFSRYSYKAWYAIAEFVDNSTSSFYKHQQSLKFYKQDQLEVRITYDPIKNLLRITDNAFGMELDDFRRAILLNARPENSDGRNEFGMGLKTAASWFGKVWQVTSSRLESTTKYTATVDIPLLEREGINEIDILKESCGPMEHGTTIEIRELTKRLNGPKTVTKIKNILRSMYRRDLDTGKIKIYYNDEPLSFNRYHFLCAGSKEYRKNLDFSFTFEGTTYRVTGFVGLLGEGNMHDSGSFKKAGFALFRRDRVVLGSEGDYYKPYEIFRQSQSRISLNLFGEIDLDDFPINQAKDGFVWDNGLEEAFVEALKSQIGDYIKLADKPKVTKSDTFDPSSKKEIEETRASTQTSLDRLASREADVVSDVPDEQLTEEEIEFERTFSSHSDEEITVYETTETSYDVPGPRGAEKITVVWSNAADAYWYKFDKKDKKITVNINHPFFQPFSENKDFRNIINKFVISIFLAEVMAESASDYEGYAFVEDINNNINDFLQKISG